MNKRIMRIGSAMAALALMVAGMAVLLAQAPSGTAAPERNPFNTDEAIKKAADRTRAEAALKNWTVSRTPWGDPDLRGYWLLATYTPLERPAELADKPFYTEEEALAAGFQIHLAKPVDPGQLVDTVASLAFGGYAA